MTWSGPFEVTMFGVRGSMPASGRRYLGVGGHTSCIGIGPPGSPPLVLLDAGTGICNASRACGDEPFRGEIVLTHLHWDHVHGLPFFASADRPDATTIVHLPCLDDATVEATMDAVMAPPHFPIDRLGLEGSWGFRSLDEGTRRVAGFDLLAREIPHKGGRTFGFRLSSGTGSIAYLPDHCPRALGPGRTGVGELHEAARTLAEGVDLLIHGAPFVREELAKATAFGHATLEYALELAEACSAKALVVTHHQPGRTDDEVEELVRRYGRPDVVFAREGLILEVGAAPTTKA